MFLENADVINFFDVFTMYRCIYLYILVYSNNHFITIIMVDLDMAQYQIHNQQDI